MSAAGAVSGAAELTAEWLGTALAARLDGAEITDVRGESIGTGQVSASVRLSMTYSRPTALPATMIAKVPSPDPSSRAAARTVRTYELEARFYTEIAPGLRASIPQCFYAAYDAEADDYVVLLEDLAPARPGDQLRGLSPDEARAAVEELAVLHAAGWANPDFLALPWLNRNDPAAAEFMASMVASLYDGFRERYVDRLAPDTIAVMEKFVPRLGAFLTAPDGTLTLTHRDFRADNLMFGAARPTILDWQSCAMGAGAADLAYFLGSSLVVEHRRSYEESLVRRYHAVLTGRGASIDWDFCWDGYRRYALNGVLAAIGAAMLVERTERGDRMFCAMADRHARHVLDLASLDLIR